VSEKDLLMGRNGPRLGLVNPILDPRGLKLEQQPLIFNTSASNFNLRDPKLDPRGSTLHQNSPTEGQKGP